MKRFHVHVHVDDLSHSIAFYSQLFAAQPARVEEDYAKWMLEDPRVNFAISTRGQKPGLDHLGFQVDGADELAELKVRAKAADMSRAGPPQAAKAPLGGSEPHAVGERGGTTLLDEGNTTCCYARSEKHWVTDPQGIAWEHFHTLGNIPVFNEAGAATPQPGACCAPAVVAAPTATAPVAKACCGSGNSSCC